MVIKIGDKKVYYEIKGEGETILFVHGWGGNINSLKELFNLASKDYQAINLELPGFGKSDLPDPTWGVGEYAVFLKSFIHKLGVTRINYFGHSYGGSLGIYLATHNPEIINKLILCDSAFKRTGKISKIFKFIKKIFDKFFLLKKVEMQLKTIAYKIFFPNSDLSKFPKLESNFRKLINQDLSTNLQHIQAKTLILWGTKDMLTPVEWAYELKEKVKDSILKIYPDKTHNLPIKYPDLVYKEIKKFI